MCKRESNALLPPMETADFQVTDVYAVLQAHEPATREMCRFLCAESLDALEFAANPACGLYTQYEQEDFDEIFAYLRYCGKQASTELSLSGWRFVPIETGVGNFVVCHDAGQKIIGILG